VLLAKVVAAPTQHHMNISRARDCCITHLKSRNQSTDNGSSSWSVRNVIAVPFLPARPVRPKQCNRKKTPAHAGQTSQQLALLSQKYSLVPTLTDATDISLDMWNMLELTTRPPSGISISRPARPVATRRSIAPVAGRLQDRLALLLALARVECRCTPLYSEGRKMSSTSSRQMSDRLGRGRVDSCARAEGP